MKFDISIFIQLAISLLFGALTGYVAHTKGRNASLWFAAGVFLTWLGLLVVFLLPEKESAEEEKKTISPKIEVKPLEPVAPEVPKEWFYLNSQNVQSGPVEISELQKLWKNGDLTEERYVWKEGMGGWKRIRELTDLMKSLKSE